MFRFQSTIALVLPMLLVAMQGAVHASYQGNMFLNGQYQNQIKQQPETHFSVNPSTNVFLHHAVISRQASPFQAPTYLPPPELLKCYNGQQCVRKDQCQNGYYSQQLPKIQNCLPESNVCCTYRPPVTTTTTTTTRRTTTPVPYATCRTDQDCVQSQDCRNGEIVAPNYIKEQRPNRCYAPQVCCRIPATTLSSTGYILTVPEKGFTLPTNPTLPAVRVTQSTYRPQPTSTPAPRPTNQYLPPETTTRPTPTPTPYRPVTTTRRPPIDYLPPVGVNEIPHREPRPTQPPTRYEPDRVPQPSNPNPVYRGEDQLSPQIFPTPKGFDNLPGTNDVFPKHYAKCASALVCTPENYCNALGVLSETPLTLSAREAAFRVPLTDCLVPDSGAPGKCCRDPNYVDPWPVNPNGVCAMRNKRTKPKGIKDIDTNFAEIPWQAMIARESNKKLLCGGAIVGDDIILTSAKCVADLPVSDVRVKAGEWQLGSTNEPLPFQLVGVKSIDVHPKYNPEDGTNNMAIIRLERRLEFATHIGPICISDKDPEKNEQCVTTGWGQLALSIHEEGAIMHVTETIKQSRKSCGADATSVCSATKFDACEFDEGSALACGSGSSVVLKGIYSFEKGCGENQTVTFSKPDISWINQAFVDRSKPLLLRRF
ncbi:PREDICTED: serine proteinase stubble [Drosophila arizonae]|uniref:Serine proteinase stubble n=1 Tax=Drosophila arizonae TaxID=7263 RepID=A0ABM1PN29_DROAR|nr:PREDICTED: serine proteinase stubble [Drosophila arizonae]